LTDATLAQIRTQFERMRALARSAELSARNDRVSTWCLAEQLDHVTKVTASVVNVLADPNAKRLDSGINGIGRVILRFGWIPRGIGKSPKRFRGAPAIAADLDAAIERVALAFDALPFDALRKSRVPVMPHPRFGGLTPPQALRFIEVHTQHHLKIIDDIVGR
jgi:DinB superfamily